MSVLAALACYVQQIGTAVPEYTLGPQESVELFRHTCRDTRTARLLPRVVRLTGIQRRHLCVLDPQIAPFTPNALFRPLDEQPHGPGMGARMAQFERLAGPLVLQTLHHFDAADLADVDTLITVSCTHALAPALERPLLTRTPLRPGIDRWNLGFMGCSAGLAAMRLVHQMAGPDRHALIIACELSSLHFQYTDTLDQLTANVLFADGAAAMTLSPRPAAARLIACRCAAVPECAAQMVWFADDHGLRLQLSQDLPDTLAAHVPGVVTEFLADCGTTRAAVDHWLVHPGGPQILDAVQKALGLRAEALQLSRSVLSRYGNMSSPTIFFILRELLAARLDGRCVALAFGPGLTIELALLEIKHAA
jgi:prepilin-type processing-associated H-X9-DG protein